MSGGRGDGAMDERWATFSDLIRGSVLSEVMVVDEALKVGWTGLVGIVPTGNDLVQYSTSQRSDFMQVPELR